MQTPASPLTVWPEGMASLLAGAQTTPVTGGRSGSEVFRLRGGSFEGFLKHGVDAAANALTDEMVRLRWLAGRVSVPAVMRFVATPQEAWLLTTALPGQTCSDALRAKPEHRLRILEGVAHWLRGLHAIPVEHCPFNSSHDLRIHQARQQIEQGLVALDDLDAEREGWSIDHLWQALMDRLPFTPDPVVTHGDFTLDNIIVCGTQVVGCIDVGRAGVADRYQDLALLWNTLEAFGDGARRQFLNAYGISDPDPDKLAFHLLLDEFF